MSWRDSNHYQKPRYRRKFHRDSLCWPLETNALLLFRTCLLEPKFRQRVYGIQFINEQERLIDEITDLLQAYNDGDDEDDDLESEESSDLDDENEDDEFENEIESGPTQRRWILSAQHPVVNPRYDDTLSEKLFHHRRTYFGNIGYIYANKQLVIRQMRC